MYLLNGCCCDECWLYFSFCGTVNLLVMSVVGKRYCKLRWNKLKLQRRKKTFWLFLLFYKREQYFCLYDDLCCQNRNKCHAKDKILMWCMVCRSNSRLISSYLVIFSRSVLFLKYAAFTYFFVWLSKETSNMVSVGNWKLLSFLLFYYSSSITTSNTQWT